MRHRTYILSLFFLFSFFSVQAQKFHFRNYSVDDGLPFVQVATIFQDSKGYLWSGGYGGLSRFDGNQFTNFSVKDGLMNHQVTCISEDDSGNVWIGTISGLSKFNGKNFINFSSYEGIAGDFITSLFYDSNANLWIGTRTGLTKYDGQKFIVYTTVDGLPSNTITCIYEDNNDGIWCGTDAGAARFDGNTFTSYSTKEKLPDNYVNAIQQDAAGNIWIATNNGIGILSEGEMIVLSAKNGLPALQIIDLCVDARKNMWASTQKGVVKFNPQGNTPKNIKGSVYNISTDLNSNIVGPIYNDYEGNLWFGTYSGLYRYRSDAFETYTNEQGLASTFIFPTLRDKAGNLIVGTSSAGLFKYENGRFRNIDSSYGFNGTSVNVFFEDSNRVYIGTDKGLSWYESKDLSKGGKIFHNIKKSDGLLNDSVNFIYKARDGKLWLAQQNGLTIYDPLGRENAFEKKPLKSSLSSSGFGVYNIVEDKDHRLWIGTWLGGLFLYDGKEIKEYGQQLGLKSATIFSIVKDNRNNMYLGTLDGVFVYDGKKLESFTQNDGLSSDLVYFMMLDDNDNTLWIGTNQGLSKLDLKEYFTSGKKVLRQIGKEDGFNGVECNSNGAYKDKDSSIWFGTVNGLIHFNPAEYVPNTAESKTNIIKIRLNDKDTSVSQNAIIDFNYNHVTFYFTGISLTNPGKVRYQYKMEGFDSDWHSETKFGIADYSYLPPGQYTFKVRSKNSEGVWNNRPVTFSFIIAAPFYKKIWFWVLAATTISLVFYLIVKWRLHQIRKKQEQEFQRKVQLARYELKALRSQMNPHFIFNSLNSIQSFIVSNNETIAAKYLNKFAKLIRMILNNSESSAITLRDELDALILYMELEELRFENKFTHQIIIDPEVDADYHEVPAMLIQPYVENAILHGLVPNEGTGLLKIHLRQTPTHIVCSIEDNGIGRKHAKELSSQSAKKIHESMGMKITGSRLQMINTIHHSNLSVAITDMETKEGLPLGTRVEIFIPYS